MRFIRKVTATSSTHHYLSYQKNYPPFAKPDYSLQISTDPAICLCSEPDESNPHFNVLFL